MKILIATSNIGKRTELLEVLAELDGVDFLSLDDFEFCEDVEENGETFEENALIKAKYYAEKFNIPTIGEDSGLILEEFPDKFGVRTRREIPVKQDEEWLKVFLEILKGAVSRKSIFYSSIAFVDPNTKQEFVTIGNISGSITESPQTELEKGIPVSSVFIPEGKTEVYSAMDKDEKNSISHRGQSSKKMLNFLKTLSY